MKFLELKVTFLDRLFHGRGDFEPEWPPSPLRVFQALVAGAAGAADTGRDEVDEALRWLEKQPPPLIHAPETFRGQRFTLFVPNNEADVREARDRQNRLTGKTVAPIRLMGGDSVHYLWEVTEAEAYQHAEALDTAARGMTALGWGIDLVAARCRLLASEQAGTIGGHRWHPWQPQGVAPQLWRVPVEGTFHDLANSHRSFLERLRNRVYYPPQRLTRYRHVLYTSGTIPRRPCAAFELDELGGFAPTRCASVAAMLRSVACRQAHSDTHTFPGGEARYVAGHAPRTGESFRRFSYLPLPTIGHEHADGRIRRLLIAEELGGSGEHTDWAQSRLHGQPLVDVAGRNRGVLVSLWRPASRRMVHRYLREAPAWSSVTPVILPGHDDGRVAKAERLFLRAVTQAGLPVELIDEVALRKAPYWPGQQHPRHYFTPNYLRHFSRWHAWIRFKSPVPGPLAVGAGRHAGLGLFAADDTVRTP